MSHAVIAAENARFSQLSDHLIRLEYSPNSCFEDRQSIRALARPEPRAFASVETGTSWRLGTGEMTIEYLPDGKPFHGGNLRVLDARTDRPFWTPETVDHDNLGGVHISMDYVKPGMIPHGVHPATIEHHSNGIEWSLWRLGGLFQGEGGEAVGDAAAIKLLFDEVLATRDFASLPPAAQAMMRERWKYPPGVLSRAGFFLYNDTATALLDPRSQWVVERPQEKGAFDLYLFYYRDDYKQGLRDYRLLFGESPLLPRYSLGLWYSRYPTFSQSEIYSLTGDFEKHELPLDVFVFDLEWHQRGWCGFDWDTGHIPQPDQLLGFLRDRDIHTTFNVHPHGVPIEDSRFQQFLDEAGLSCDTDGVEPDARGERVFTDFDVAVRRQAKAFMDVLHKPVQDDGVDFWWIDGECRIPSMAGLDWQLWTNHVYCDHIQSTYPQRRPMVLSRTPGFGAHRYPFHFTADAWSYWETLENQVEQTLRAGHLGQSYISHDVGGHISSALYIDSELYMRWIQFAALSPVFRLHSSKQGEGVGGERRPWIYGERVLASFKAAMRLRMELLPYLYTLAWQSHCEGIPICRSNILECPGWQAGGDLWDSYFLGDRIYAAPVLKPGTIREVCLPPGRWVHGLKGHRIDSESTAVLREISPFKDRPLHYYKAGTILVEQPYALKAAAIPQALHVTVYPDAAPCTDRFVLYEDDGLTQAHRQGESATRTFSMKQTAEGVELEIAATHGTFAGLPRERLFHVRLHGGAVAAYVDDQRRELNSEGQLPPLPLASDAACGIRFVTDAPAEA